MIWLFKCISGVRSSALASGGAFPLTSFDGNTGLLFANTSAGNSAPSLVTTPFFLNPSSFSLLPANLLSAGGALNLQLTSDVATTTKSVGVASTAKWGSAYSCATTKNTSRKPTESVSKLTKNAILGETFYSRVCGTLDSNQKHFRSFTLRQSFCRRTFNRVLDVTLLIRLDALNKWIEFVRPNRFHLIRSHQMCFWPGQRLLMLKHLHLSYYCVQTRLSLVLCFTGGVSLFLYEHISRV